MSTSLGDAALEARRVNGREEPFETLYRRYAKDVYRSALRLVGTREDAEDVTQIAFMNAYRALAQGARPAKPRAWLVAIVRHVCCRRFRQESRHPREAELDPELAAPTSDGDGPTADEICSALRDLNVRQRTAFVMREIEGLTYADIAAELDLSIPAVEMLIFRARRALREQLELADLTPRVAFASRRRRRLGSLFPLPASLERAFADLGLSFARAGAGGKVALTVGAAAFGTSVAAWTGALPLSPPAFGSSAPAPVASEGPPETGAAAAVRVRLESLPGARKRSLRRGLPEPSVSPPSLRPDRSEPSTPGPTQTPSAASTPSREKPATFEPQAPSPPSLEPPTPSAPELQPPSLPAAPSPPEPLTVTIPELQPPSIPAVPSSPEPPALTAPELQLPPPPPAPALPEAPSLPPPLGL